MTNVDPTTIDLPVCERRVNLLVYSLSLHRHSYIGFILVFVSSIHNKQQLLLRVKYPEPVHPPRDPVRVNSRLCLSRRRTGRRMLG
jgi:hypothetical protein